MRHIRWDMKVISPTRLFLHDSPTHHVSSMVFILCIEQHPSESIFPSPRTCRMKHRNGSSRTSWISVPICSIHWKVITMGIVQTNQDAKQNSLELRSVASVDPSHAFTFWRGRFTSSNRYCASLAQTRFSFTFNNRTEILDRDSAQCTVDEVNEICLKSDDIGA